MKKLLTRIASTYQPRLRQYRASAVMLIAIVLLGVWLSTPTQATVMLTPVTDTPTNTPTATNTPTNTPIATPLSMVNANGYAQFVRCGAYGITPSPNGDCFQSQMGAGWSAYSAEGQVIFHLNGETGAIQTSGSANFNSLTLATPLAAGQYVAPTLAATPTPYQQYCGSQTVIGVATVNPTVLAGAGITTPSAPPPVSLGSDPGGNVNIVSSSLSSGIVTLKTWKEVSGTPAAATTAVAVAYCINGSH